MFKLDDAMRALEGREEFAVKRRDGFVIVNYLVQIPDSFEGIRANFRGVTFNEASGEIVSLPLHKFFNVNQKPDTQIGLIGHLPCTVYEKHDGTMCHALEVNGQVVLASRMGGTRSRLASPPRFSKRPISRCERARATRSAATSAREKQG